MAWTSVTGARKGNLISQLISRPLFFSVSSLAVLLCQRLAWKERRPVFDRSFPSTNSANDQKTESCQSITSDRISLSKVHSIPL